jgi:hypothetical protein
MIISAQNVVDIGFNLSLFTWEAKYEMHLQKMRARLDRPHGKTDGMSRLQILSVGQGKSREG